MGWIEELETASYRGVEFQTKRIGETGGKKGTVNDPPGQDGGTAQDLGNKARSFSIAAFVAGDDYKTERDNLIAALEVSGPGEYVDPTKGNINAFPTAWSLTEDINEDGGFARFSITFFEVQVSDLLQVSTDSTASINSSIDAGADTVANNLQSGISTDSVVELDAVVEDFGTINDSYDEQLSTILTTETKPAFDELLTIMDNTTSDLVANNELTTLANNYYELSRIPNRAKQKFSVVVSSYRNLIDNTLSSFPVPNLLDAVRKNQSYQAELIVNSVAAALAEAANQTDYATREEALSAGEQLSQVLTQIQDTLQEYESEFSGLLAQNQYNVSLEGAQTIDDLLSETIQSITSLAFNLSLERQIIIDRDRTLIDLAFELFPGLTPDEMESKIDQIISINRLNNPTILKNGEVIVYYA